MNDIEAMEYMMETATSPSLVTIQKIEPRALQGARSYRRYMAKALSQRKILYGWNLWRAGGRLAVFLCVDAIQVIRYGDHFVPETEEFGIEDMDTFLLMVHAWGN